MLGIDKNTGEKFAIKVIDKVKNWSNPKFFEALEREVKVMMEVQHVWNPFNFTPLLCRLSPSLSPPAQPGRHCGLL